MRGVGDQQEGCRRSSVLRRVQPQLDEWLTHPTPLPITQAQKEKRGHLLREIEAVRGEHATLSGVISKANTKIMAMTEEVGVWTLKGWATGHGDGEQALRGNHT